MFPLFTPEFGFRPRSVSAVKLTRPCSEVHAQPDAKALQDDHRLRASGITTRAGKVEVVHLGGDDGIGDETNGHASALEIVSGGWVIKFVDLVDPVLIDALVEGGAEQRQRGANLDAAAVRAV